MFGRWAPWIHDGGGGCAEFGEQQAAAGIGGAALALGVGPDEGSVGELLGGPAGPECFEQVVFSAQADQIRCTGGPVRVWNRVVDVGDRGWSCAAGKAACLIAAADELCECARRPVSRFGWGLSGVDERPDGGVHRELRCHWSRDDRAAEDGGGAGGAELPWSVRERGQQLPQGVGVPGFGQQRRVVTDEGAALGCQAGGRRRRGLRIGSRFGCGGAGFGLPTRSACWIAFGVRGPVGVGWAARIAWPVGFARVEGVLAHDNVDNQATYRRFGGGVAVVVLAHARQAVPAESHGPQRSAAALVEGAGIACTYRARQGISAAVERLTVGQRHRR